MFNHLPGVIVNTVDGGLAARRAPKAHSVLVIGTADRGVADQPFQVTDRAAAALVFGFNGNLIRAMEEVATYSDNIILFRMGTKPMILSGVGHDLTAGSPTAGFNVAFAERTLDALTRYQIWYNNGVLAVWLDSNLIYSNQLGAAVDVGDLTIDGPVSVNAGLQLGTGANPVLTGAVTIQAASAFAGTANQPAPTLVQPVTGIGLRGRQTYVALAQALDLLNGIQVEQVYCPGAILDQPNVAFYIASDAAAVPNNPATNPDALDWLKTSTDAVGNKTYQWASEVTDSAGNIVTVMAAASAADRLSAGFHEVNFGYLLASFAAAVSVLNNTCIAFIGTSSPKTFKLVDVRNWIGSLPGFDPISGNPKAPGRGLLGNPYTAGTTSSKLNPLCADFTAGFRNPGFFESTINQYDAGANTDINGNPIDIGAFLHIVADQAILSNGWGSNYIANIAGIVCGFCSVLDEKSALTNKPLKLVQIPGLVYIPNQLDSLTQVNINVLRSKGVGNAPVLLHDMTAANDASDYTNLVRVRVKGLVIKTMLDRAYTFVGESSTDGLQLQAMKTALDADLVELGKRGYISKQNVAIQTTAAQARIGHAALFLTFRPADELIQLTAYVGLTQ